MTDRAYYSTIPHAPPEWDRKWAERVAYAVNTAVMNGNCTNGFTLEPNVTTTTMTDTRIHPDVVIGFMATTASAAAAQASIYVTDIGKGTATIHHASSADIDQTFRVSIVG